MRHGHTGNTRHSPRNGFTVSFVLSPVIGLFCHRHLRDLPQAWHQRRDVRTTRLHRPQAASSSARCLRPPHPVPTSVTFAKRPS